MPYRLPFSQNITILFSIIHKSTTLFLTVALKCGHKFALFLNVLIYFRFLIPLNLGCTLTGPLRYGGFTSLGFLSSARENKQHSIVKQTKLRAFVFVDVFTQLTRSCGRHMGSRWTWAPSPHLPSCPDTVQSTTRVELIFNYS